MEKSEWMVTTSGNFVVPNGCLLRRINGIKPINRTQRQAIINYATMLREGQDVYGKNTGNALVELLLPL
jgi:hypothetical protein